MNKVSRCGYVAIIGRPNVGKSTLLNHILGQKICITSRKPQTTRHRILGIKTEGEIQTVYVDTPGLHQEAKKALNRYMNKAASAAIHDVDVIVFIVEALKWQADDEWILQKLKHVQSPVILVINKVDKIADKQMLLPFIEELSNKFKFNYILPMSALKNNNVIELENLVNSFLPENPHFFPDDQVTDASERFLASEIIREKLMRSLGQELPYALTVQIEQFKEEKKMYRIGAIIWVEKLSQKAIVIGAEGGVLKKVGTRARKEMELLFETKIFLQLWVKVKESWSDSDRALQSLGYRSESD
ncbi:MAG: GTPase Era [Gammaproteobacteria bacterium]|nr:GTPase Era [Gammaproteobacteria bacterium]